MMTRAGMTERKWQKEGSGQQKKAAAPVSKTVTIAFHRDRGLRHQMIWTLEIGETWEVHVERCNHWHRLWKVEAEFAPDMDTHDVSVSWDQRRFGGNEEDQVWLGEFADLRPTPKVYLASNIVSAIAKDDTPTLPEKPPAASKDEAANWGGLTAADAARFADLIEPKSQERRRVADAGHARLA